VRRHRCSPADGTIASPACAGSAEGFAAQLLLDVGRRVQLDDVEPGRCFDGVIAASLVNTRTSAAAVAIMSTPDQRQYSNRRAAPVAASSPTSARVKRGA